MIEKPKILLISYIYPPAPGGGNLRLVRWTRALSRAGYEPIVITVKSTFARGQDQSLDDEVKEIARIERTASLDPKRIFFLVKNYLGFLQPNSKEKNDRPPSKSHTPGLAYRIFQALRNWLLIPDEMIGWIPFALARAIRIIRKEKPVLMITSSSPHSVQLVGLLLKKFSRIPWLADFRDAWSRHPYYFYPNRFYRRLNRGMERAVVKNADAITFAYGWKEAKQAYPEEKGKFYSLHNGFNEKDFQGVQPLVHPGFNLLYLGAFYGTQTPEYFFAALKELLAEHPELKNEIKVHLIGLFNPEHREMVRRHQLEEVVLIQDFIPHQEVASWMMAADALLLFLGCEIQESMVIPGKVFEYIRAPGWILAMIPEGETAEILRAAGGSVIVPGNQPEKIQAALLKLHQFWKQGKKPARNQEYVMSKEESRLKREMIKIVSSLIAVIQKR